MPLCTHIPSKSELTDVVWIQTSFIGDIVLTTGAIARAQDLLPHVRQHLITTDVGKGALTGKTCLTSIHTFDKRGGFAAILELRRVFAKVAGPHRVILQPHRSVRSSLLAHALGGAIVTYRETHGSWFASQRIPRVAVLHEADRIALLLEGLDFSREHILPARPILLGQQQRASMSQRRRIAVSPGSTWGTKRWLPERFAGLIQKLLGQGDIDVVILGSTDEQPLCASIAALVGDGDHLQNMAGKTNLSDLPALYGTLDLLVTNDSSPIHYASACSVPTIAIFGATTPGLGFGPLADHSEVVENKYLSCRPCSDHGPQVCPLGHFKCMKEISVDHVYNACLRQLEDSRRR